MVDKVLGEEVGIHFVDDGTCSAEVVIMKVHVPKNFLISIGRTMWVQ